MNVEFSAKIERYAGLHRRLVQSSMKAKVRERSSPKFYLLYEVVGGRGLEPLTSAMSTQRSNQLS